MSRDFFTLPLKLTLKGGKTMPNLKIKFEIIVQDTQDYSCFNKDENHMVSTLYFSIEAEGATYNGLSVEVRQPFGANFESDPLEVATPKGEYSGGWDHSAFSDLCEAYYRSTIGSTGTGIRISGGGNIRMKNNTFAMPATGEFSVPEDSSGGW
jgi:hypothetical protein